MAKGSIYRVAGPIVVADNMAGSMVFEVVRVGIEELVGEIIALHGDKAYIQVYEDTTGLSVGEPVIGTGSLFEAELGPGLLGSIYDGLQRPEEELEKATGSFFIPRGTRLSPLPRDRRWEFVPRRDLRPGDRVSGGDVLGTVPETSLITHKIMIPPGIHGKLVELAPQGKYTIDDTIATIQQNDKKIEIKLSQKWPIRKPRPFIKKLDPSEPFLTGIRVIDYIFPLAKGGKAAVPGGFGTGKTVLLQEITKWSDADVSIYVGCGERGNEMSDALQTFRRLMDPRRGKPVMERSVFIANTSNMPVAARETSIFLGATIAEYYRDMGYNVLLVADSTSRWAEALREIGSRMEEMPGEEGYPAYLASRLAEFYERAGRVKTRGKPERTGSITIIGAVSPPGGDFSEPVTQATLRLVQALYALDYDLATKRHFPAVNWITSFSHYVDFVRDWWDGRTQGEWSRFRSKALEILVREAELADIVRLVDPEALPEPDKLSLDAAYMVRVHFLQQSAYSRVDAYSPPERSHAMMKAIMAFYEAAENAIDKGVPMRALRRIKARQLIARLKEHSTEEIVSRLLPEILDDISRTVKRLIEAAARGELE